MEEDAQDEPQYGGFLNSEKEEEEEDDIIFETANVDDDESELGNSINNFRSEKYGEVEPKHRTTTTLPVLASQYSDI